jgi:hypothetical protein
VYTRSAPAFDYGDWLQALRDGKTFITNGAALGIRVNGEEPGSTIQAEPGSKVHVEIDWRSHYAVNRIEIIQDGAPVRTRDFDQGSNEGTFDAEVTVDSDGWIAARLGSDSRDSFAQALWAHTSPVYLDSGGRAPSVRADDAQFFVDQIDDSLSWINTGGKFYTDAQRNEVLDLFASGRQIYAQMTK